MNSNAECPICMEPVCASRNCIITECGHSFHSNCLFKHTAMNGFHCPYCRTSMADVPEDEEEYEDEDEFEFDDNDDNDDNDDDENNHAYNYDDDTRENESNESYVLDGFRWMFQQANGQPLEEIDYFTDAYETWHHAIARNKIHYDEENEQRTKSILDELSKMGTKLTIEDFVRAEIFRRGLYGYHDDNAEENEEDTINKKYSRKVGGILTKVILKAFREAD